MIWSFPIMILTERPTQIDFENERGLFRPLLYAFLGLEKYFFGYHFYAWHLTGIVLQLLVVFWFLKICLEFYAGLPAILVTFLFALFYPNMELVIWENITAYLLAVFLLLVALYHTFKLMTGCKDIFKRIRWIFISLFFGVFIYEPVNVYALMIFIFLWSTRPEIRKKLFVILVPNVLYVTCSALNYFYINHLPLLHTMGKNYWLSVWDALQMAGWWFYSGMLFYLYPLKLNALQRDVFDPSDALAYKPMDVFNPFVMISVFYIICFLLLCASNRFSFWLKRKNVILLIMSCCFLHALILAVFRVDQWGVKSILLGTIYNQYIFWLFTFLLMFVCIDWQNVLNQKFSSVIIKIFMVFALLFGLLSGYRLFVTNSNIARLSAPELVLIKEIEKRKTMHGDFQPDVNQRIAGNDIYIFRTANMGQQKNHDGKGYQYVLIKTLMAMLYPQYSKGNDIYCCSQVRSQDGRDSITCADQCDAVDGGQGRLTEINLTTEEEFFNLGTASFKQGNFADAISDFSEAVKINPKFVQAYNDRGFAYYNQGRFAQAISDYNKAIEIDLEYADAYYNRGLVYDNQGRFAQAISDYNKAIEINPAYLEAYNNRAHIYIEENNFTQAISDYNKVIEINPGFAQAYTNQAIVYYELKNFDKAWDCVHKAEKLGAVVNPQLISALKAATERDK